MSQAIENEKNESAVERVEAKVKSYNREKGYGFLTLDDDSDDIFLHFSVLDAVGYHRVEEGDLVVCDIGPGKDGQQVLRILEIKICSRNQQLPEFLTKQSSSFDLEGLEEMTGEIKWFNPTKGFGFIYSDDGGQDIFVHGSVVLRTGYQFLRPGMRVLVKVFKSERGREARSLTVIGKEQEEHK